MGLREARTARSWSQGRLILEMQRRAASRGATLPGRDSLKAMVSRWENGHSQPDPTYRTLLRETLGLTDAELGFATPAVRPAVDLSGELKARLASSRGVDAAMVQLLQGQTDQMRLLDRRLGAPAVLEQMRGHVQTVETLLSHAVLSSEREPLAAVLSDAAALAGWQALDVGSPNQAWTFYEMAKVAAREAGSAQLLAHSMGEQAYALLDLDQPDRAIALIREAQIAASSAAPVLRSWLHAAEAEACAAGHEPAACRRALDAAHEVLPDHEDPDLPYLSLNDAHLARWRGHSLARLGDESAVTALYTALDAMDGSFTRARAGLHCDLALAHLVRHEGDEATKQADHARQLAAQVGSLRQQRRVDAIPKAA